MMVFWICCSDFIPFKEQSVAPSRQCQDYLQSNMWLNVCPQHQNKKSFWAKHHHTHKHTPTHTDTICWKPTEKMSLSAAQNDSTLCGRMEYDMKKHPQNWSWLQHGMHLYNEMCVNSRCCYWNWLQSKDVKEEQPLCNRNTDHKSPQSLW